MPFSAIDADTSERVSAFSFGSSAEIRLRHPHLVCPAPDCGCKFYPRAAAGRVLHFVHKQTGCKTQFGHHPESQEHLAGKAFVIHILKQEYRSHAGTRFETELPLREAGEFGRIADVVVVFPDGGMEVHEVQLASITTQELAQRTEDYGELGIDVCWWLGKTALTVSNQEWCLQNLGGYRDISFEPERRAV